MEPLTERQREVLKFIVEQYVESSLPVPSRQISRDLLPQFSSATIRNDMAELERIGLITHLHTSAGRIPTDTGYRYFVESLMGVPTLSHPEERLIRHQFHQVALQLEQWTRLAAAVLAQMVGLAAIVTAPVTRAARLKHVELVAVQDSLVLVVAVTQAGTVKQTLISVDDAINQAHLRTLSDGLTQRYADKTAEEIAYDPLARSALEAHVTREVAALLKDNLAATAGETLSSDGLSNVLRVPEFSQGDRGQRLLTVLREGGFVQSLVPYASGLGQVQVLIGDEVPWDELRRCAVVLARYGAGAEIAGMLAVIGPTRMHYERSIATVRFMSGLMSDLLLDLYSV